MIGTPQVAGFCRFRSAWNQVRSRAVLSRQNFLRKAVVVHAGGEGNQWGYLYGNSKRNITGLLFATAFGITAQKNTTCESADDAQQRSSQKIARTAVLVRMHDPSEATLERLSAWVEDLCKHDDVDLWVSVDVTWKHFRARERIEAAIQTWPVKMQNAVGLHFYDRNDLLNEYPALIEVWKSIWLPCIPGGGTYLGAPMSLRDFGWGFHPESINVWFQKCISKKLKGIHQAPRDIYDFVWVLEDDVGFSDGLYSFVKHYVSDSADLVTGHGFTGHETAENGFGRPQPQIPGDWRWDKREWYGTKGWCWYHVRSSNFRERIEKLGAVQLASPEHAQRFSRNMLDELHNWGKADAIAWSEMSTPTICKAISTLRCRHLDSQTIGVPYSFKGRISREDWAAILNDPAQKGKIFHALKF